MNVALPSDEKAEPRGGGSGPGQECLERAVMAMIGRSNHMTVEKFDVSKLEERLRLIKIKRS